MDTSVVKFYKSGIFLWLSLPLFFTFMMVQGVMAQSQQAENEALKEATNPAEQVADEIPVDAQSVAKGQQLFGQHCSVCHMVDKQMIGPALASVHNRRPVPWLIEFIKNSQSVIEDTDDEYAQHLFEQYNNVVMPQFDFLSDEDIYNVLAYIKAESVSPTSAGGVSGTDQETVTRPQDDNVAQDEAYTQRGGEAENVTAQSTSFPLAKAVVFGLSMLVVIAILVYIIKKSKSKQNA